MSPHRPIRSSFDALREDLRYGTRQLLRAPGFALVAILSLAVGIGANVTVFSAAHAFLGRGVDAVRSEELVRIYRGDHSPLPRDWYLEVARNARSLSGTVAEDLLAVGVAYGDERERTAASVVSENFFAELGVSAATGTLFRGAPGEAIGAQAVLTHAYWQSRFGGDPGIVGRTVRINDLPFTIVGVSRPGFRSSQFGWGPQIFVPFSEYPRLRGVEQSSAAGTSTYLIGRLAPGRSAGHVADELRTLAAAFPRADTAMQRAGAFTVEPALGVTAEVRGLATAASVFLLVIVGLVLLIVCANLANMLLARSIARRRELAIRTALGVSRARLVQQLLTESALISVLGAGAGVGLASYATRLLPRVLPADAPIAFDLRPDATVLGFAVILALATGLVVGLLPALRASRTQPHDALRSATTGGSVRSRLRSAFLGAQVALALSLLVVSGLFLRGLDAARSIDPGFVSTNVVNVTVDLSLRGHSEESGRRVQSEMLAAARAMGDVEAAAFIGTPPLNASNSGTSVLPLAAAVDDRTAARGTTFTGVSPGYFDLVRLPLLSGRAIEVGDRNGAPRVAVVNQSFARMLWPDSDPVGQQFRIFGDEAPLTVVGLVRDIKYKSLNDANEPFMYVSLDQFHQQAAVLQVRLRQDTPALRTELRRIVQAVEPGLAIPAVQSAEEAMAISLLGAKLGASLIGAFGVLALLLAALGVYGVTAFVVGQRTAEIGIRTALGAPAGSVMRGLMVETLKVVGIGAVLGLAGGIGIGKVAASSLYGVGALDPVALASASGLLVAIAVLGTWLPARRALRMDPISALRAD